MKSCEIYEAIENILFDRIVELQMNLLVRDSNQIRIQEVQEIRRRIKRALDGKDFTFGSNSGQEIL